MKTIILLIFSTGLLLQSSNCKAQKSTIFGQVFLITSQDTIASARLSLFQTAGGGTDRFVADYYSDGKGRFVISDLNYGRYCFKVFYGNNTPLIFFNNGYKSDRCPPFTIDLELKGVPTLYVRN
jgi:hypothetical protein